MKELEKIYEESIELIDATPRLTTDKIPNHLLNVWLYNGAITPDPEPQQLISIAIYKYANDKYGDANLPQDKSRFRYEMFQYLLAIEFVCRKISARFRSRYIFDFQTYNQPLNIDINRKQFVKFQKEARLLYPLRNKVGFAI